jgi:hypothetical protein
MKLWATTGQLEMEIDKCNIQLNEKLAARGL